MRTSLVTTLFMFAAQIFALPASAAQIQWQQWDAGLFDQAKSQKRFVLLDLEAVWCHWCHVMEKTTYHDPRVVKLLKDFYIPVRVDQDANPDLSNRYGDWGWPATIIFAADGSELVKMRGYLPPERMISLLEAVIKDPTPGPSVVAPPNITSARSPFLSQRQRDKLTQRFVEFYDEKNGGWGRLHKYIDTDAMDYALSRSERGSDKFEQMARHTFNAARHLLDPEWGGVYQYSDALNWQTPHYEKIMWFQAQYMRQYAQAFARWGNKKDLAAAQAIAQYLLKFWTSPDSAFYTSQDADVDDTMPGHKFYKLTRSERETYGREPRIDKSIYARENGWAIQGLVALYNVTNNDALLDQAMRAARYVLKNRKLAGGGFRHGSNDRGGPFLGDTLAMARAALDLFAATGDREWLRVATDAGHFIGKTFKQPKGGFVTAAIPAARTGVFNSPVRTLEEQPRTTRFFNLLFRYTGVNKFQLLAEHGLKYMAADAFVNAERPLPGLLLAEYESANQPVHITVIGSKHSPDAQRLHAAARRYPALYKQIDWWDRSEGSLPHSDVTYPELDRPAAFACANGICSLPVFSPGELSASVARMAAVRKTHRE